ncbi:tRNA dihydrouridine synthase DusB [Oribacterium sinus]
MSLKDCSLPGNILMAPMAGVTDLPYRILCKEMGLSLSFTEMVSAKAIYYGNQNTDSLLEHHGEPGLVSAQLFGSDPALMAEMACRIEEDFDGIDVNMGCPVPKVVRNQEGSALMTNIPLAEQVLSTMAKALKKPLTVKFRIGFTDDAINVVEFAKMAEASGVASVTIHGRTREQYYRGKANWQYIKEAKEAVKIPVFGNGDIFQEEDALAMLLSTGVDGIALARGIQGNPFLIRACVSLLSEGKKLPPVSLSERKEMMLRHLKLMVEIKGEHLALLEMRKHLSWYMEGLENAARWRQRVNTENDLEKVFQMVREL